MTKIKRNTVVVGVSLLPQHIGFINHLMKEKAFMSASDVHRRAIEFLYDKMLPGYIYNKSAADLIKRDKILKEQQEESITPEEFAASINARFVSDPTGKNWVVIGFMGNSLRNIEPTRVKELFKDNPGLLDFHKEYIEKFGPIPDTFPDDIYPR